MKRILYVKIEVDWEEYDAISDELLFDDVIDYISETDVIENIAMTLVGTDKGIDYEEFKQFID